MKISCAIFLVIFTISFSSLAACLNADKVNLRGKPDDKGEIYWRAEKNTPLHVLTTKDEWVYVKDFEDESTWVKQEFLDQDKHFCGIVKDQFTNLRDAPSKKAKLIKNTPQAERYTVFKILGFKNDWVKVKTSNNQTAWINKKNLWIQK